MINLASTKWTVSAKQWLVGLWYAVVPSLGAFGLIFGQGRIPTKTEAVAISSTCVSAAIFYLCRAAKKDDTAEAVKVLKKQAEKEGKEISIKAVPSEDAVQ